MFSFPAWLTPIIKIQRSLDHLADLVQDTSISIGDVAVLH